MYVYNINMYAYNIYMYVYNIYMYVYNMYMYVYVYTHMSVEFIKCCSYVYVFRDDHLGLDSSGALCLDKIGSASLSRH